MMLIKWDCVSASSYASQRNMKVWGVKEVNLHMFLLRRRRETSSTAIKSRDRYLPRKKGRNKNNHFSSTLASDLDFPLWFTMGNSPKFPIRPKSISKSDFSKLRKYFCLGPFSCLRLGLYFHLSRFLCLSDVWAKTGVSLLPPPPQVLSQITAFILWN